MPKRILARLLVALAVASAAAALLPFLAFEAAKAGDEAVDVSGEWVSTYGPVTLLQTGLSITGSYVEGTAARPKPGVITSGKIDLATRTVVIVFHQDWNKTDGSATLTLSEDGTLLEGTATESGQDGDWSGSWNLRRK